MSDTTETKERARARHQAERERQQAKYDAYMAVEAAQDEADLQQAQQWLKALVRRVRNNCQRRAKGELRELAGKLPLFADRSDPTNQLSQPVIDAVLSLTTKLSDRYELEEWKRIVDLLAADGVVTP